MQLGRRDLAVSCSSETTNTDVYPGFLLCVFTWFYKHGIVLRSLRTRLSYNTWGWCWAGHSEPCFQYWQNGAIPSPGVAAETRKVDEEGPTMTPTPWTQRLVPSPLPVPSSRSLWPHLREQQSSPSGCPLVQQATTLAGMWGHEVPGSWAKEPVGASLFERG